MPVSLGLLLLVMKYGQLPKYLEFGYDAIRTHDLPYALDVRNREGGSMHIAEPIIPSMNRLEK